MPKKFIVFTMNDHEKLKKVLIKLGFRNDFYRYDHRSRCYVRKDTGNGVSVKDIIFSKYFHDLLEEALPGRTTIIWMNIMKHHLDDPATYLYERIVLKNG